MLLSFTVGNFKSFNKPGTLTMFKGNVIKKKDHLIKVGNKEILKGAIIYGSNAGGKSSFVDAIQLSKTIILSDMVDERSNVIANMYCRTDEQNRFKPTLFEYNLEIDGICYKYKLEIVLSERKVVYEYLAQCDYDCSREVGIFERVNDSTDYFDFDIGGYFSEDDIKKLKDATSDLESSEHSTLLSILTYKKKYGAESRLHVFNRIKDWFKDKLCVNKIPVISKEESLKLSEMLKHLIPDFESANYEINNDVPKKTVESAEKILSSRKIKSIAVGGTCVENNDGSITAYTMKTHHKSSSAEFDFSEESDGVHETFNLIHLLSDFYKDYTFIYDEFGSSMHPLLAYRFIELFFNIQEENNIQLIIATHHTSLMTTELYRIDEIWFIDKKEGESEIYSLHEFTPRSDISIKKNYFAGRYGALPVFDEM